MYNNLRNAGNCVSGRRAVWQPVGMLDCQQMSKTKAYKMKINK
jgi:hypothetical protein